MVLILSVLPDRLAICRLPADAPVPAPPEVSGLWSVTRTQDELSLVLLQAEAPAQGRIEPGWRAIKVAGPLDFSFTGILAALAGPLADAGISLFAVSTFDTDYVLVREVDLERAQAVYADDPQIGADEPETAADRPEIEPDGAW
jgi:uncharacterized protein